MLFSNFVLFLRVVDSFAQALDFFVGLGFFLGKHVVGFLSCISLVFDLLPLVLAHEPVNNLSRPEDVGFLLLDLNLIPGTA